MASASCSPTLVAAPGSRTAGGWSGGLVGPGPEHLKPDWPVATPWIPMSQTVGGIGSVADPHEIKTLVTNGDFYVVQRDTYVDGADRTKTEINLVNATQDTQRATLYAAGDCIHTDPISGAQTTQGFGWRSGADILAGDTGCSDRSYSGNTLDWRPSGANSSFTTNTPARVGSQMLAGGPMDNACLCAVQFDDAAGLSWSIDLAGGASVTVRFDLVREAAGPDQPTSDPGGSTGANGGPIPWNMQAIGAPTAWAEPNNLKGAGQVIGIVDSGVDFEHEWLGGPSVTADPNPKIVDEGCWSTEISSPSNILSQDLETLSPAVEGTCPTRDVSALDDVPFWLRWLFPGRTTDLDQLHVGGFTGPNPVTGPGASAPKRNPCEFAPGDPCSINEIDLGIGTSFFQGTFVAGLAAGNNPRGVGGVAPQARILATNASSWRDQIQQKSVIANPNDLSRALRWIDQKRTTNKIAAVNLMLPGALTKWQGRHFFAGACMGRSPKLEAAIDLLVSHRIPVVIAAGDNSKRNALPWPACLPNVISVGSTDPSDAVTATTNLSSMLTLVAPGQDINSAWVLSGDETRTRSGTYAAAAQVTGAIALYKQKYPSATASQIRSALVQSGLPTKDRLGVQRKRLRVDRLLKIVGGG